MKFADETALMFLLKSILLTDWIRVKKRAFSQHMCFKSLTKHALLLLLGLICHLLYWFCLKPQRG